jgi:hypothetical protein
MHLGLIIYRLYGITWVRRHLGPAQDLAAGVRDERRALGEVGVGSGTLYSAKLRLKGLVLCAPG